MNLKLLHSGLFSVSYLWGSHYWQNQIWMAIGPVHQESVSYLISSFLALISVAFLAFPKKEFHCCAWSCSHIFPWLLWGGIWSITSLGQRWRLFGVVCSLTQLPSFLQCFPKVCQHVICPAQWVHSSTGVTPKELSETGKPYVFLLFLKATDMLYLLLLGSPFCSEG